MKKITAAILAASVLLACAAGCGQRDGGSAAVSSAPAESSQPAPLEMEELTVELPKTGADLSAARAALELLPSAMARHGVRLGAVSVSFGSSEAATAAALAEGNIQLAFLRADALIRYGGNAVPLLADAQSAPDCASDDPSDWNAGGPAAPDAEAPGIFSLLCAAPTDYGRQLSARVRSGKALTQEELKRARWGVLDSASIPGFRCAELWLEDHCQGTGLTGLSAVTSYAGWEELLRAAAAGEIDLFPLRADLRTDYAALWTMESTRVDAGGLHGFGRSADIWSELPVLAVTERLYDFLAAAAPGDAAVNDSRFRPALEASLSELFSSPAEELAALGAGRFAAVEPAALDGMRRLLFGTQP